MKGTQGNTDKQDADVSAHPSGGPTSIAEDPTTSFLTAVLVVYTSGAGITAAAGTRLALR